VTRPASTIAAIVDQESFNVILSAVKDLTLPRWTY
jgi:hypothetical protein